MNQFLSMHKLYEEEEGQPAGLSSQVPTELQQLLRHSKSNSYANGFFRFITPDLFRDYFKLWNLPAAQCVPFIKCGFGHLIFYQQDQYKVLNPVHNCVDTLGARDELEFVVDIMLCDRVALENSFFIDVYEQVSQRIGPPRIDEIYAFIPALRMGGSRDVANVRKVKMSGEMMILAQL